MINTDILIIGSGPGGAISAWESIKKNRDVLLIDAGSNYNLDSCIPFSTKEMEQKYKHGGITPTFNKPKITYVEGETVGGGSEVNSGFYHRPDKEIIRFWEEKYQIEQFSTRDLFKHAEIIEKEISVSYLPNIDQMSKASLKLKNGADKLGWSNMEVPRWFKFNRENKGTKQSMTETYIKWYLDNGGQLISNLKAFKLKFNGSKWIISCLDTRKNDNKTIIAKNLFLCGGAISTPFLLRSSGIKKNVGNTLQMHPTVKVIAEFNDIVNSKNMGVPVHQVKEFSPEISIGCSVSSKPYLALSMLDNVKYIDKVEKSWENMAIYYAMIKPLGFGKVRKIPFFKDPFINYQLIKKDMETLSTGLKIMCKILLKSGAKNIYPSIKNYGVITSLDDINRIPKYLPKDLTSLMSIHLFSSCPMGENKKICSANSFGKVFGFNNLFINDGSLIPSAPGINPQGTIMAIARRNIQHFLESN